jgi:drug/metabolite transporter (DMT)-like permease
MIWDHHTIAFLNAFLYVLSGCSQPLMMTIATDAGLADPVAQVYMLFYYLGPSFVIVPLLWQQCGGGDESPLWPSRGATLKAVGIALFDIVSTSMNYTGASLAGPTIFSIVYSSVTIWTAVFSQLCLGRQMNQWQWMGVGVVFGGLSKNEKQADPCQPVRSRQRSFSPSLSHTHFWLALTATDSLQMDSDVVRGLLLVLFGSAMHAMTYILCEAIMTVGDEKLSVQQTCGIQAGTACLFFLVWQFLYTIPRRDEVLLEPMQAAGTTVWIALGILSAFALANLIHSITFYETLVNYPGGSTSAGVFKGLQAVLVFVVTHVAFCGRTGGEEMCFTSAKFLSLITVVGGVVGYGVATHYNSEHGSNSTSSSSGSKKSDYESIKDVPSIEIEPLCSPGVPWTFDQRVKQDLFFQPAL